MKICLDEYLSGYMQLNIVKQCITECFSQEPLEMRQGRHCYHMLGQSMSGRDKPYIKKKKSIPDTSLGCCHESFESVATGNMLFYKFKQIILIHCSVTGHWKCLNMDQVCPNKSSFTEYRLKARGLLEYLRYWRDSVCVVNLFWTVSKR